MDERSEELGSSATQQLFDYKTNNAEFPGEKVREIADSLIAAFVEILRVED